jgi:hypothetical protein
MTPAELVALREVEAAEQAVNDAMLALGAAREHLAVVIRRESRRKRARGYLRVVKAPSLQPRLAFSPTIKER